MAEAAAARQQEEFDRLIAEKKHERREVEAEERKRQSQRVKFECDMAVLTANKRVAIADTKQKAIEQAIKEDKMLVTLPSNEPVVTKEKIKP